MAMWRGTGAGAVMMVFIGVLTIIFGSTCAAAAADIHGQRLTTKNKNPIGISSAHANIKQHHHHHRHQVVIRSYYIGTRTTTTMNQQQKQTRAGSKSDGNYMTNKRKVPNGPDPIHNRRAGNSRQPPGQA